MDTVGMTELYLSESSLTHSTVMKAGRSKAMSVECATLDSLFPTETIDLLKIDVEGAELQVLKGAERMLSERRVRDIILEYNPRIWSGTLQSERFKSSRLIQERGLANMHIRAA